MAYLGNPAYTMAVLEKHGFHFQKKYGQNFLIDTHILEKIIDAAEITKDDFVLEIGPEYRYYDPVSVRSRQRGRGSRDRYQSFAGLGRYKELTMYDNFK